MQEWSPVDVGHASARASHASAGSWNERPGHPDGEFGLCASLGVGCRSPVDGTSINPSSSSGGSHEHTPRKATRDERFDDGAPSSPNGRRTTARLPLGALKQPVLAVPPGVTRVVSEGRLRDLRVTIERSTRGELRINVQTRCHGKSIRSRMTGWRSRYTEVAYELVRELLYVVRAAFAAATEELERERLRLSAHVPRDGLVPPDFVVSEEMATEREEGDWDGCGRALRDANVKPASQVLTHEEAFAPQYIIAQDDFSRQQEEALLATLNDLSMSAHAAMMHEMNNVDTETDRESFTSAPYTSSTSLGHTPGVNLESIEWANGLRFGGDSSYDPEVDGDLVLRGLCIFDDPTACDERIDGAGLHASRMNDLAVAMQRRAWYNVGARFIMDALDASMQQYAPMVATTGWVTEETANPFDRRREFIDGDGGSVWIWDVLTCTTRTALVRIRCEA
jgi:hypothetical protein